MSDVSSHGNCKSSSGPNSGFWPVRVRNEHAWAKWLEPGAGSEGGAIWSPPLEGQGNHGVLSDGESQLSGRKVEFHLKGTEATNTENRGVEDQWYNFRHFRLQIFHFHLPTLLLFT